MAGNYEAKVDYSVAYESGLVLFQGQLHKPADFCLPVQQQFELYLPNEHEFCLGHPFPEGCELKHGRLSQDLNNELFSKLLFPL